MSIDRIQGTDGIRRPVLASSDERVADMTPQQAFLECGVITEQFCELYTYAYVTGLQSPGEIVIGWDPRDPNGLYTDAAIRGIRRAGATAVRIGITPTPGVALYQVWRGATAAFMVTASHNFRSQNGIKIFYGPHALKLFPDDDRALTKRVLGLDYKNDVLTQSESGGLVDAQDEAHDVFRRFHMDVGNSWLPEGESLGDFPLIIDAANGAMSGLAADVFGKLHGGDVLELNNDTASGDVNRHSGVADLEGVAEITRDMLQFADHAAVQQLFVRGGKAAVFDADGDRFFRLDHDPDTDTILVLSGDETAVHQARHLAPPKPGTLYINTVESDLNAARAGGELGYTPVLTGVGDKWVLRQAADSPEIYGIGSEETGHNISRGRVTRRDGETVDVFLGNGLKSALNTFVATRGLSPREAHRPFPPGFKRTFYVYYTTKELFAKGSEAFSGVGAIIEEKCTLGPTVPQGRPEEPDMLYLAVRDDEGRQRAGVFVRNSGTEEKTGVNVRGDRKDAGALIAVGEAAVLYLARTLKDWDHPMAQAEKAVLEALEHGPLAADALPIPDGVHAERLLEELANKEKVIAKCAQGYERTPFGARMLEAWK